MQLACHSLSFRNADASLRSRYTVPPHERSRLLSRLGHAHPEAVCLFTCNRVEIYTFGASDAPSPAHSLARFMGIPEDAAAPPWELCTDEDAVFHLLKLACGLESMVVGETEIFRQLKHAYADATAAGTAGTLMHRLFQRVFSLAKQVRSGTELGRIRVSVAGTAVDWALSQLPDLGRAEVVVWGTGVVGRAVVHALARRGVPGGVVVGHRMHPARMLAKGWGGRAVPAEGVRDVLATCDACFCCTAAPHAVLDASLLPEARASLLLVDLAVPRDVNPDVTVHPYVGLMDLDSLQGMVDAGGASTETVRTRLLPGLRSEAEVLWSCLSAGLHDRCLAVWRAEVERDMAREVAGLLAENPGMSEAERERLARLSDRLLHRMLDRPSRALRGAIQAGLPCLDHLPEPGEGSPPTP